jgi:hypothetical protein
LQQLFIEDTQVENPDFGNSPLPLHSYDSHRWSASGAQPGAQESQTPPPVPSELARLANDEAGLVSQGDAASAQDLSTWVQNLRQNNLLDGMGYALKGLKNCNVAIGADGHVRELVFNSDPLHPVDVKINDQGDVSINGKDKTQLAADSTAFLKSYADERLKLDKNLGEDGQKQVSKLENLLLDGNSKGFVDGVKDLLSGKNIKLASAVAARLSQDLKPTNVRLGQDGVGNLTMKLQYSGVPETYTEINKDGEVRSQSVRLEDHHLLDVEGMTGITAAAASFKNYLTMDANEHHQFLVYERYIDDSQMTGESLADKSKLYLDF